MLEKGKVYSREEWERETSDAVFGLQKDILKDKYAPDIPYADFFMGLSRTGRFVYCVRTVADDSLIGKITGKRKFKILGVLSKDEYDRV
jgi:hypothetical protein